MRQLSDCSFIQYCVIVYEFVLLYVFVLFISILYVFVNCICYVLLSITNLTIHDTIQFKIRPSNSRFESQFYYHDCDNQSTVSLAHSPVLHARTKHMEICSLLEKGSQQTSHCTACSCQISKGWLTSSPSHQISVSRRKT